MHDALAARVGEAAEPLPDPADPAFGEAFDRFACARIVLLGEASHGTSEFYRARAAITRRLIEEHGFTIVAVEADWPDAATIDRYVRHKPARKDAEPAFRRFPTWMWRNTDVEAFTGWLREHNRDREPGARAGFHGLDLYNLNGSIRAVIDYLDRVDPATAALARERYACLTPFRTHPARYGRVALTEGFALRASGRRHADRPVRQVPRLPGGRGRRLPRRRAERPAGRQCRGYHRAMYHGAAESWNLRDQHMFDTLELLLAANGDDAKAVVWAHNSHIGDARYTDMGRERGELNIGQLCRETHGDDACLIGFGTHTGTVAGDRLGRADGGQARQPVPPRQL